MSYFRKSTFSDIKTSEKLHNEIAREESTVNDRAQEILQNNNVECFDMEHHFQTGIYFQS